MATKVLTLLTIVDQVLPDDPTMSFYNFEQVSTVNLITG
jgi:hypothetical protein